MVTFQRAKDGEALCLQGLEEQWSEWRILSRMCDGAMSLASTQGCRGTWLRMLAGLKPQKASLVKTNKNKNPNKTLVGVGLEGERRGGREVGGGKVAGSEDRDLAWVFLSSFYAVGPLEACRSTLVS